MGNGSSSLKRVMIGFNLLGLAVATYLTIAHYTGGTTICPLHGGCETVQHSTYSMLAGVSVALIGLIGYILILATLLAPESEASRTATMALTLGGLGFSAYLTYRELFSIHAICPWCVSSAIILTILTCLALLRFLRGSLDEPPGDVGESLGEHDGAAPLTAAGS
jgi:uncharacterized membrane protein